MNGTHIYKGDEVIAEIQRRLKNLRVESNTQVKIDESGDSLIVTPVRDETRAADFKKAMDKAHSRYKETFRALSAKEKGSA